MSSIFVSTGGCVRNGWKVTAFFTVTFLLSVIAPLILEKIGLRLKLDNRADWILAIFVLVVSYSFAKLEGESIASLGWKIDRRWAVEFLAGTLGGAALILLATGAALSSGAVHFRFSGQDPIVLLSGAWMFLGVAVFEEAASRGYPFQRLVRGMGFWPAQALMAVCFAMAHWGNPGMYGGTKIWATLNIGLAAVLLGLCWRRNRSMALPIGLHFGWNWAMGSLLGLGVSGNKIQGLLKPEFLGRPEWMSGGAFGLEGGLPGLLVLIVGIVLASRRRDRSTAGGC